MKFLGRIMDDNTMTWSYPDGSGGKLPDAMRQEVKLAEARRIKMKDGSWSGNGIFVIAKIAEWKDRLGIKN